MAVPPDELNALALRPEDEATSSSYSDFILAHSAFLPLYNHVNSFIAAGKNATTPSTASALMASPSALSSLLSSILLLPDVAIVPRFLRLQAPLGLLVLPECPLVAPHHHSAVLTDR